MRPLTRQLLPWAQPENAVLRHELERVKRMPVRVRLLAALGMALAFGTSGYLMTIGLGAYPVGQSLAAVAGTVAFWALLFLQFITGLFALLLTAGAVGDEMRRNNWDNLRSTARGAELALRARWMVALYRLRDPLGVILLARLLLVAGIIYNLTTFEGRYLDLLMTGNTPELPLAAGVLLLALLMTAALIMPVTAVGLDAASGLLLSVTVRRRVYSLLLLVLLVLARLAVMVALLYAMIRFAAGQLEPEGATAWLLAGGHGGLVDGGLAFLYLDFYGELWRMVPWGIMLGPGLLLFALFQALLADRMIALAVRYAERHG